MELLIVDHQRWWSMSNDWRPTRVRRERCNEQANFEVTPRDQHLTWIAPSTYQGTMDALKTVQHKGRYYRNILVKVDTSESRTTAAWASPWRMINWCALIVLDLDGDRWSVRYLVTQLPDDLARVQWHFTGPTAVLGITRSRSECPQNAKNIGFVQRT